MENFKEIKTEELGKLAMASIEKGDVARDKSANLYITAGQYLAEAKRRVQETKVFTWPEWLAKHCPIGRSRANEIIMISDGRATLDAVRAKKALSVAKTREKQKVAATVAANPMMRCFDLDEEEAKVAAPEIKAIAAPEKKFAAVIFENTPKPEKKFVTVFETPEKKTGLTAKEKFAAAWAELDEMINQLADLANEIESPVSQDWSYAIDDLFTAAEVLRKHFIDPSVDWPLTRKQAIDPDETPPDEPVVDEPESVIVEEHGRETPRVGM